jgi:esterase/lipase superfamily enzyme
MAYTDEQILRAARAVLAELDELLGTLAGPVRAELTGLLARASTGEDVANDVLDLLWRHEPVRQWVARYLTPPGGSDTPAGDREKRWRPAAEAERRASPAAKDVAEYTVWYGTTRRPVDPQDAAKGYSAERDQATHYGSCRVFVPKSHKIGSIGSPWWKRLLTLTDDRLRLLHVDETTAAAHWQAIKQCMAHAAPEEQHALVFIHGYNVSFERAALRAAQIGFDLSIRGAMAFFSWPSQGTVGGYPADEATIEANEDAIADYLMNFAAASGAAHVHVIAHSMGNRGFMRAVARLADDAQRRSGVRFGQFILAAADVDADKFRQMSASYSRVATRTTLYVSNRDLAVEASQWLHQFPRAGLMPPVTVAAGLDTINVTNADLTLLGHGYVASARNVLVDMHTLIHHNAPPAERFGLEPAETERGERYWVIGD